MDWLFRYFEHRRKIEAKRAQRAHQISSLPDVYFHQITTSEQELLNTSLPALVDAVHNNVTSPLSILHAYGKAALLANEQTNCLTEVLIPEAEALLQDGSAKLRFEEKLPLAGIPVSLKDMINVAGYDTSIGMTCKTFNTAMADAPLVRLLRDAGAILHVKTTVPITMLSFETTSPLWGTTTNAHNAAFSPGGSSGGDAALISLGGARVGVGSDLAGSVRVPAHFSGIYSLKCSSGRWPKTGIGSAGPGQEGVPSVLSPMARSMEDLTYFTKSVVQMQPWKYDHGVTPLPWRDGVAEKVKSEEGRKKMRIGIMRSDSLVDPSPACARAIDLVASSLRKAGFDVHDVEPPQGDFSPFAGLCLAAQLINADGCRTIKSILQPGEWLVEGAAGLVRYMLLPRIIQRVYLFWVRYIRRDHIWADLLQDLTGKNCFEQFKLVSKREAFRARWFDWWKKEEKLDFLITAPNATPAIPHGAMREAGASCSYAVLYNLLDYTAGVLPVTRVDAKLDRLPADFRISKLNGIARGAYMCYDANEMHGLPVGVQVIGHRLEEERVLAMMELVQEALEANGEVYEPISIEI